MRRSLTRMRVRVMRCASSRADSLARPWAVAVVSEKITSVSKMHRMPSVCASMRCTGGCGAQGCRACGMQNVRFGLRGGRLSRRPAVAAWRLRAAAGAGSPCARAYLWAARAHNRTNTKTTGVVVQHARSSAESFALCKTPRAVQTSARAQDVAAEGCGKLSRESSHASPRPPRVRVRPMTDLRLWRQIVPGSNLALR